jgi:hypothetical protein
MLINEQTLHFQVEFVWRQDTSHNDIQQIDVLKRDALQKYIEEDCLLDFHLTCH